MKRNPTPRRRYRNLRSAFTLIELLVAISILSIMLFLINIVFVQTTQAVSTGIRQSNILAVARSTNDRISRDASAMLGPNSQNPAPEGGGYIVIINHRIVAPVKRADGTERLESFRVDQLVFMASAEAAASKVTQFRGAAPRDASQYGSDFASPYALVRYGHGRRVERDGFDIPGYYELGQNAAGAGQQVLFGDDSRLSGRAAGLDRLANDWMLARQAVLFNPTDRNNNPIDQNFDYFVVDPRVGNVIVNDPLGRQFIAGFCDVTTMPASSPASGPTPGFVDAALDPNNPGLTATDILNNYLDITHVGSRLRVNPIPVTNVDADNNNVFDYNFEAAQVGQLHGIFAPNCSDFIVQFAADANNDGEVDRVDPNTGGNTGTEADGDPIYWYDYDAIAELGFDPWDTPEWSNSNPAPLVPTPIVDVSAFDHGTTAFIFRYEDDQAFTTANDPNNSKWPYLIRIRYRLHDAPGHIEGNASFRIDNNIDEDGDGAGAGGTTDNDEAKISGQYFEQIIRVPRPQTP